MAFRSRKELNGQVDPNINQQGRIKGIKDKTRREIRSQEFLSLLRKIKPHLSESIMTAATIMKNKDAGAANQLKAAVILLNAYRELVGDAYSGEDDGTAEEVQPNQPVFSLKMIGADSDKE